MPYVVRCISSKNFCLEGGEVLLPKVLCKPHYGDYYHLETDGHQLIQSLNLNAMEVAFCNGSIQTLFLKLEFSLLPLDLTSFPGKHTWTRNASRKALQGNRFVCG